MARTVQVAVFFAGIALVALFLPGLVAAQIRFERTYGGDTLDYGLSVQQTEDGGYVVVGYTYSFGAGGVDAYLVKTDSVGDTVWTRTYGGSGSDRGHSVQQTEDGGYILTGYTSSFGAGSSDFYLVKTDSAGDSTWARTYGGTGSDRGYSVLETDDGGYILAGYTYSFGAGNSDAYLVKTDSVGDTVWARTYGGSGNDAAYCVQETRDGGYILTGYTSSFGAGSSDFYLVKTDSAGSTMWTRTYGGSDLEYGYSVQETQDGGYILAGYTESYGAGWYDVYLVKTDSMGDSVWASTYGGSDEDAGECVQQTEDGGYIISGYTWSSGAGRSDVYLVKTDSLGGSIWARTYGGTEWDFGYAVRQTEDSGYIVVGSASSFGAGSYDVYLVKTDSNGRVGVLEERPKLGIDHVDLAQNCPNPFWHSTVISYSLAGPAQVSLGVYDVTGRFVERLVNEKQDAGIHRIRWDPHDTPTGIYFYRLEAGESVERRKMVLAR